MTEHPIPREDASLRIDPKGLSFAPWTPRQVEALNLYQQSGAFHPFTCGTEGCGADLVALAEGWDCRACHLHSQRWAHNFMVSYTDADHPMRRFRQQADEA